MNAGELEVLINRDGNKYAMADVHAENAGMPGKPLRVVIYQDELSLDHVHSAEERESFFATTKTFIGDHEDYLDAVNEALTFWGLPKADGIEVYGMFVKAKEMTEQEAVQYMKKRRLKYVLRMGTGMFLFGNL